MECWLYNQCNHKDCDKDFCIRKYKLDYLYNNSLLSPSQRYNVALFVDDDNSDLEAFKQLAAYQADIVSFVESGQNLYLHSSNCGNGKTSWAVRFIQAYFNKIWPKSPLTCRALFISVPRFLLALKDNIQNKNAYVEFIKENIMSADLVVWDDIATKVGTEFELNHLLSLIDGRIALGKSNIYTSNLDTRAMYNALGERLASRVCLYSKDIELKGADKRQMGGGNK